MQFSRKVPKYLTVLLVGSLSLAAVATVAEDGTSGITPEDIMTCQIVPAASNSSVSATPVASPVATPMSSPVASPVVESGVDPLTADLTTATDAILNCMSENNLEALTSMTGPDFRGTWLGFGESVSDDDFAILLPMLPLLPYELVSVENVQGDADSATATINYTVGRQLLTGEWSFALTKVDGMSIWQVRGEELVAGEAPASATQIELTIADGSFTFSSGNVQGSDFVIDVTNTGAQPHEVLILRAPEGMGAAEIAAAPTGIPEGATFIAQATVPTGTEGTIILTDLRPGTYTVVDLLPDASGMPNVSSGMITTLEITAP